METGTARIEASFPASRERNCPILIRKGLFEDLHDELAKICNPSSFFIITDSIVRRLYGEKLKQSLSTIARTEIVSFKSGESNKRLDVASVVASEMSGLGADRSSAVIALGGGVVGDLAGFVASMYKRGIDYFQVPTSLIAQVDSSIGGKTGVDTPWGKNQLGTFYQPRAVYIDPSLLDTLPQEETINGLAEIVKCAIIGDLQMFESLFELIFRERKTISPKELKQFIPNTCSLKARVATQDEREENLRAILNYGHTIGHAIEASSGFRASHGKAVVLGMIAEGWVSSELDLFLKEDYQRQEKLLKRISDLFNLKDVISNLDNSSLMKFASTDKKNVSSSIRMSLPSKIGEVAKTNGSFKIPVQSELCLASINYMRKAIL